MGLLDNILGGDGNQGGGGPSKMTLALMALLAYRTYQGKGRLADMLGRGEDDRSQSDGQANPRLDPRMDREQATAGETGGGLGGGLGGLGGLLGGLVGGGTAGRAGGQGGGLGDLLGGILGGGTAGRQGAAPAGGPAGGGLGGLLGGGGLGGLLGGAGSGAAGGFLGAGLSELLGKLQQNGQGDVAQSWVGRGENRHLSGDQLEQALGRDTLQTLSDETGRPYQEVLSELSAGLPHTVDKLTPDGRLPTPDEQERWV